MRMKSQVHCLLEETTYMNSIAGKELDGIGSSARISDAFAIKRRVADMLPTVVADGCNTLALLKRQFASASLPWEIPPSIPNHGCGARPGHHPEVV
eukprot:1830514-Pyramimonas_sp.AAC.1